MRETGKFRTPDADYPLHDQKPAILPPSPPVQFAFSCNDAILNRKRKKHLSVVTNNLAPLVIDLTLDETPSPCTYSIDSPYSTPVVGRASNVVRVVVKNSFQSASRSSETRDAKYSRNHGLHKVKSRPSAPLINGSIFSRTPTYYSRFFTASNRSPGKHSATTISSVLAEKINTNNVVFDNIDFIPLPTINGHLNTSMRVGYYSRFSSPMVNPAFPSVERTHNITSKTGIELIIIYLS
jgi:hypothetical protein